jgi:phosphoglycerate dehydrogenase-like enzyme
MSTTPTLTLVLRVDLDDRYLDRLRREVPEARIRVCTSPEALRAALGDADALIGGASITAEEVAAAPRLRWVQATIAGVEGFLIPALRERPIVLTNFSGIAAPSIAEHVLALMLAFARGLPPLLRRQDRREWGDNHADAPPTFELAGQTLGIVGLGDIGEELARRAHALGMHVQATDRDAGNGDAPAYIEALLPSERLPDLLADADHVALCLPLTPATEHLIGRDELARMGPSAYLYNVGRGEIVDQEALVAALRDGTIAGAGLDVAMPEPLPADSPLWALPNVLITGHTAGRTPLYWERGIELLIDNVRRFLAGEELRNTVDTRAGY